MIKLCRILGCGRPTRERRLLCPGHYTRDYRRRHPRWTRIRKWWRRLEQDPALFRAACLDARTWRPDPSPSTEWGAVLPAEATVRIRIHRVSVVPE